MLSLSLGTSAHVLTVLGEANEALSRLREGEQLLARNAARGHVAVLGWVYWRLRQAALVLGRLDEARRLGECAVQSSSRQPGHRAHAQHLLGEVATHPDSFDAERGEVHYRKALALAEPRGMRPTVAHCHLSLGKLHRRTANPEQAQEHHRDGNVPRNGHDLLAGAGGSTAAPAGLRRRATPCTTHPLSAAKKMCRRLLYLAQGSRAGLVSAPQAHGSSYG